MNFSLIIQIAVLCIIGLSSTNAIPLSSDDEYGDKYQGDIVLTPAQVKLMESARSGRTGIIDVGVRWPKVNGRVILPYVIDPIFTTEQKEIIYKGMKELSEKTCVGFVERTTQTDYISVISDEGCYSYLGRTGGKQDLSLNQDGCLIHGTVMHEFIHALGYKHMHQHPDRDEKVTIMLDNIETGRESQFTKLDPTLVSNFRTPYDIESVMHYRSDAFTKNGLDTIVPKNPSDASIMGQRSYLTRGDVLRVINMYNCPKTCTNKRSCGK